MIQASRVSIHGLLMYDPGSSTSIPGSSGLNGVLTFLRHGVLSACEL